MVENTWYSEGTFCWADVAVANLDAAAEFYATLFGWEVEERTFPESGRYIRFRVRGKFVTGAYEKDEAEPPHWGVYVKVDAAEAAAKRAEQLGASIVSEARDVEEDGRLAKIADPTGGVLGLWQPTGFMGADLIAEPGALTWFELMTPDPARAAEFYRELFGYGVQEQESPTMPGGTYRVLEHLGENAGGIMPPPQEGMSPSWTPYVDVEDVDGSVERAAGLGAAVMMPPTDIPEVGRLAWFADPQGAVLAVIQPETPA